MRPHLIFLTLILIASAAHADTPVFDLHVHLWKGEESLRAYESQLKAAGLEVTGLGVMWFGGPNQALQGQPAQVRANNDSLDYPQYSLEQNARALERLGLDEAEKAKIRFGNAQKLFGLTTPGR